MGGAVRRRKPKPSRQNSSSSTGASNNNNNANNASNNANNASNNGGSNSHSYPYSYQKQQQYKKNISLCLARGATARNLHPSTLLQALSAEDTEKDLRHMQAYAAAAKSYQQQYYIQHKAQIETNALVVVDNNNHSHNNSNNSNSNTMTNMTPTHHVPLPVRIDPEEEKRLLNLRKKIGRAEVIREEAEQHYVASRAHYVATVQDLQVVNNERAAVHEFLQKCLAARAAVVACQRARLQMSRDMKDVLQARIEALQNYQNAIMAAASTCGGSGAAGAPTTLSTPFVPHLTGEDPLTTLWNQVEDDYRKACLACLDKRKKPLPWPASHLPATPPGIPALVSAASTVPDKSIAWQASSSSSPSSSSSSSSSGGLLQCRESSLVWTDGHLPTESVQEAAQELADVERLELTVAGLERELEKERQHNQAVCRDIGVTRTRNDEWVAMMCVLRQETEAVLHRHNTILQSDQAILAAQKLSQQQQEEEQEAAAAQQQEKATTANAAATATTMTADETKPDEETKATGQADKNKNNTTTTAADDANEGDDERSNNDEAEEEDWNHNNNNKRVAEESEGTARGKRRRL